MCSKIDALHSENPASVAHLVCRIVKIASLLDLATRWDAELL